MSELKTVEPEPPGFSGGDRQARAGIAREGAIMKRITYYACAGNGRGRVELMFVVRENGRQVSQAWTGETYRSVREALNECGRRNCKKS